MDTNHKTKLTETVEAGSVSEDYFYRMLSPLALKKSGPYNEEEEAVLRDLIPHVPSIGDMNFVVIGAGELWFLRYGLEYAKNYIAVEPLIDVFVSDPVRYLARHQPRDIILLDKKFGDLTDKDIPPGNTFWVFLFNILAYIENPVETMNKLLRKGDVFFISSWSGTEKSKAVRGEYFDYLNGFEKETVVDPDDTVGLCRFDNFPFQELKFYKKHERIKGEITDILIIYT